MLFEFIFGIFETVINVFLSLLPVITLPLELLNAIGYCIEVFASVNRYLPCSEFLMLIGLTITGFIAYNTIYFASRSYKEFKSWIPFK